MSTPRSKAADIAARQVEQIVEAAQLAADRLHVDGEKELADRRREVEKEGARIRSEAKEEAQKALDDARVEALKITEEARKKAEDRVETAEKAADEALADAKAMSEGLRRLASALESHAQGILRDVQAGHRELRAELRLAGGGGAGGGSKIPQEAPTRGASSRRRGQRGEGSPFDEMDVPSWVGPE
jgi:hypothetical protein